MLIRRAVFASLAVIILPLLNGCGAGLLAPAAVTEAKVGTILGAVHGGQQPVAGSHIHLLAAATTGYGDASTSLITSGFSGTDTVGHYVSSGTDGSFSLTGTYTCTAGTQVYIYANGGDAGSGANSLIGFLALLGQCPSTGSFAASVPFVSVNEVSTVAGAYAVAGFATSATAIYRGPTALAATGLANAFANAAKLADVATGSARSTTPVGNATVPQAEINTLANILASCINSTGSTSANCQTLIANSASSGTTGLRATDTATAAINIAHRPAAAPAALFALQAGIAAPFAPSLTSAPNDFTILISGTLAGSSAVGLSAMDAAGSLWVPRNTTLTKTLPTVAPAPGSPYAGGGLNSGNGVAIDLTGNVWIANAGSSYVSEFTNDGAPLSATGYTGGGLNTPKYVAISGSGDVYFSNRNTVSRLSSSGAPLSPPAAYTGGGVGSPGFLAVDANGDVWVAASGTALGVGKMSATGVAATGSPFDTSAAASGVAIDYNGNAWVSNTSGNSLDRISTTGTVTSYTGGGLVNPSAVAIDGASAIYAVNVAGTSSNLTKISSSGFAFSPVQGYAPNFSMTPSSMTVDGSGNVWVVDSDGKFYEFIGLGAPVVTPLSYAASTNNLANRP